MEQQRPEFDRFSGSYEELLRDPIRDRFTGPDSDFFHVRKRDLIRAYFRRRAMDTSRWSYLDVGCGKGELLTLLRSDFRAAAGCDVSREMMSGIEGVETRVQEDPLRIPFPSASFDFVTVVCVYHHVPPDQRGTVCAEVSRVLKPGGVCAVIEHNPYNPATRLIVSRTPVDADAILLTRAEGVRLLRGAGFTPAGHAYFLYLPKSLYRRMAVLERLLAKVPLGGQWALFGAKPL